MTLAGGGGLVTEWEVVTQGTTWVDINTECTVKLVGHLSISFVYWCTGSKPNNGTVRIKVKIAQCVAVRRLFLCFEPGTAQWRIILWAPVWVIEGKITTRAIVLIRCER